MATGTRRGLLTLLLGFVAMLSVGTLMMPSLIDRGIPVAMVASLPEPPIGWEVGRPAPRAQRFSDLAVGGISRTYVRNDLTMTVTVSRSEVAVAAARAAAGSITDPQMQAMMGGNAGGTMYEPIEREGWEGWKFVPESGEATATAYRGDVLVQLTGTPPGARALRLFLDALGWDALDALATAPAQQ